MSYLRFDYGRPPSRTNVLLRLLSASCPDVVHVIRGKPVLSTGVITTSVANAARKLQQHHHSTGVRGGEEKDVARHAVIPEASTAIHLRHTGAFLEVARHRNATQTAQMLL